MHGGLFLLQLMWNLFLFCVLIPLMLPNMLFWSAATQYIMRYFLVELTMVVVISFFSHFDIYSPYFLFNFPYYFSDLPFFFNILHFWKKSGCFTIMFKSKNACFKRLYGIRDNIKANREIGVYIHW